MVKLYCYDKKKFSVNKWRGGMKPCRVVSVKKHQLDAVVLELSKDFRVIY